MIKFKEKTSNKLVYEQPHNPIGLTICLGFCLAPLCFWVPHLLSHGDRSFTCYRVDGTTVNCEVVFKPLLPLPQQTSVYTNVKGTRIDEKDKNNKNSHDFVCPI